MAANPPPETKEHRDPFLMVSNKWRGAATEEPQTSPDTDADGLQISRAGITFESEPVAVASGRWACTTWLYQKP